MLVLELFTQYTMGRGPEQRSKHHGVKTDTGPLKEAEYDSEEEAQEAETEESETVEASFLKLSCTLT